MSHLTGILDELIDAMRCCDAPQIVLNFRAGSISLAPIGIRSEGVTVEMRRHIACQPGIGIVAPCTAEVIGFFEENHVCDTDLPQFYGSHDPGRPRADDCYPQLSSFIHTSRPSDVPLKIPLAFGGAFRQGFAKLLLLDFSGCGHRQLTDQDDLARYLVAGELAATEIDHLIRADRDAGASDDKSNRDFVQPGVRASHHSDLRNLRQLHQEKLDLGRRNILSSNLQHVLVAPDKAKMPVWTDYSGITCMQPTVLIECLRGSLGILVISEHAAIAALENFALLSVRHIFSRLRINNPNFDPRHRVARSRAALLIIVVEKAQGLSAPGLRHAPAR